jgi:hypothetical protein
MNYSPAIIVIWQQSVHEVFELSHYIAILF